MFCRCEDISCNKEARVITTIAQSDVCLFTKMPSAVVFGGVSGLCAAVRRVLTVSAQVFKRGLNLQLVTERQRHSEDEDFLLQPVLSHFCFHSTA